MALYGGKYFIFLAGEVFMSEKSAKENMARRRRESARKIFVAFFSCLLIIAASLGVYAGFRFTDAEMNDEKNLLQDEEGMPTIRLGMSLVLMGVDERKDDVGRSDTLMFLNFTRDEVSLLSIPRDTRVYIERRGYEKINAAYSIGGKDLACHTVEDFLGVNVDRYVKIDTHAFPKIIDELGGVDIYVERDMRYQHLDVKSAVEFVRFRDSEGDVGRVRRQQAFMKALAEKITEPETILKLPQILSVAVDAVETDLSLSEMLALAGTLKSAESKGNIQTGVVPGYLQYIEGVSYLVPDAERLGEVVMDNLKINSTKRHFERLALDYDRGMPADFYDVNPNLERDLQILDDFRRARFNLDENKL